MKGISLNKKTFTESAYSIFMMLMWAMYPILHDIVVLGGKFVGDSLAIWFVSGAMIFLGLCSFSCWRKYLTAKLFVVYFVICFIFLLEITIYYANSNVLEPLAVPFLFLVVPYIFLGAAFDINKLEREIYVISLVSIIVQAFFYLVFLRNFYSGNTLVGDQIAPAYQTLPHVLVVLWQMIKRPNIYNISIFALGMFVMLSLGNRGSILSIVAFTILYLLLISRKTLKMTYKIFIAALFALFVGFFNPIMDFLAGQTESYGMSMSFFNRLSDDITDSNGRDSLYGQLLSYIKSSPLFGYGLGADRNLVGNYSHNFVLELIISFGIIIGVIISLSLVILVIKSFVSTKDSNQRAFILILIGPSFIKLSLSGSFLMEPYLFFIIGYCMSLRYHNQIATQEVY